MKNVIIRGVYAVGMHHWGSRSLTIDEVLYLKHEPENIYDKHAVAICSDKDKRKRCAYLRKKDAEFISVLFQESLPNGPVYLKAKDVPTKFNRYSGPMQICNLGFKTEGQNDKRIREICINQNVEVVVQ